MKILSSAVLVTLFASSLNAQNVEPWGEAGDWEILIDTAEDNGCLARKTFEDGTLVQIGVVPVSDGGFFAAYNAEWTDIEADAQGTVTFDFGEEKFAGDSVGKFVDELPGGYAYFDNPAFLTQLVKRNTVKISGDGGTVLNIELSGTTNAVNAVLACQEEQPEVVEAEEAETEEVETKEPVAE